MNVLRYHAKQTSACAGIQSSGITVQYKQHLHRFSHSYHKQSRLDCGFLLWPSRIYCLLRCGCITRIQEARHIRCLKLPRAAGFPWSQASPGYLYTGLEEPDRRSLLRSLSALSISPCGSFINHRERPRRAKTFNINTKERQRYCENILFHCVVF